MNELKIQSNIGNKKKEVVVVLPYTADKVLMQLRDIKEGIQFSGCWGFFGGSIDNNESPEEAAERELFEEIGYRPNIMYKIGFDIISDLGLHSHAYCCHLAVSVKNINLMEGLDLSLFSLEEIITKKLYSGKMGRLFPVIESPYIINTIKRLWMHVRNTPK